jgi:hypothetical protein
MLLTTRLLLSVTAAAACSSLRAAQLAAARPAPARPADLRAKYVITVADDFIADVYRNGRPVPDAKRQLLEERFGATVERLDTEVRKGDWLVFNVVNNRMRWGGAYYFAVAGCVADNELGFVSRVDDGNWSACDTPADVDRFITRKTYFQQRAVQKINQPWSDGDALIRQFAGNSWNGAPVWGATRNTWVKVIVE